MYFLRATRPSTILSICECISGSPPGMDTIGVPHSSTALKHSSGVSSFFKMCGRVLDFSAARARQIAAEQRLQHQHEGIALASLNLLLQDVSGYRPHLGYRYWHRCAYTLQVLDARDCGTVLRNLYCTRDAAISGHTFPPELCAFSRSMAGQGVQLTRGRVTARAGYASRKPPLAVPRVRNLS